MPPRLSKRQQREKEEMEALASPLSPSQRQKSPIIKATGSVDEDSDKASDREPKLSVAPVKSAFAILADTTPVAEQSEEEEEETTATSPQRKKNKKKKKKATTTDGSSAPSAAKAHLSGKKPESKKAKNQAKEEDDLDRALAELSLKYSDFTVPDPSFRTTAPAVASALQTIRGLLSLQPKFLDADAEMRKFFGSKVISAAEASTSSGPGFQQPRAPPARSTLCRPQATWPPAGLRDGLSMRPLTVDEIGPSSAEEKGKDLPANWKIMSGDKWFTVEHSPTYRWNQAQFIQAVGMLDPNNLFALMRESYWHVDTLLQIAEVYRAQDDYSVSSDFIARALFAYERSFSGAFNLASGASRLDFRKVENRSLFLALHRTILYLERRGTMRTAFEFARLLLTLDPWNDPHGAFMHMDFLAVKAEQYDWFLEMEEAWEEVRKEMPSLMPLSARPGWRWSKALVLRGLSVKKGGGEKRATEELKQAILAFPEVLVSLNGLIGLTIPPGVKLPALMTRWNFSNGLDSALWLMTQTYANRSVSLWKIPETVAWLNSTLQAAASEMKSTPRVGPAAISGAVPSFLRSVIRHAIVSDLKPLAPFIGSILSALGPQEGYDVMQPEGEGATVYDEEYFSTASAETAKRRREGLSGGRRGGRNDTIEIDLVEFLEMLEAVLALGVDEPRRNETLGALQEGNGAGVVRQLERWVRQHPDFAEQFPNATAYLRQPAAQRPRAVHVVAEDAAEAAPRPFIGNMPGAFAGDAMEEQEAEEVQEEHEEEEDMDGGREAPILPVRIAHRLIGMLWGRAVENPEEPESDDEIDQGYDP